MPPALIRTPADRRRETGRRVFGWLAEVTIKAYGAAAAVSVALSDADTLAGKSEDALAAVPNLAQRYQDAEYAVEHREEIQTALDYVQQNAPSPEQLDAAAQKSTETLTGLETTLDEVTAAKESITTWNVFQGVPDAFSYVNNAFDAMPGLDSIRQINALAESLAPLMQQVEVLGGRLYEVLLILVDNFASDEIGATVIVMGTALALAYVLGTAFGFWARRGRPGLISRTLQSWGARVYQSWYVSNLEHALSPPLYAAARKRTQSDILADPQSALDPEALRELELYFETRRSRDLTDVSGS